MTRRDELVHKLQALSTEEGRSQPSAAAWLQEQDDRAKLRRERHPERWQGRDYQDDSDPGHE